MIYDINFRKLNDSNLDYKKIYNWCKKNFVYEWFEQRILSYDEIVLKYKTKLNNKKQDLKIITVNNKDIGLVQIYEYEDDIKKDIIDKDKKIYEYDLYIGEEEFLNKGIGKEIIKKINDIIFKEYKADIIILRPFKRNIRAIKCYEKCGFTKIYEYIGKDTLGNDEIIDVFKIIK